MIDPARLLLLALFASVVLTRTWGGSDAKVQAPVAAPAEEAQQSPLDSAAAEHAVGRPWHAARLLGSAGAVVGLEPRGRLVLARAETDARRWGRVRELLEGAAWLDQVEGGEGWALLGRALEETAAWAAAADAYGRYLTLPHAAQSPEAPAVRARLVRALENAGSAPSTVGQLEELRSPHPQLATWAALDAAGAASRRGAPAQVRSLLALVGDPELRLRAWDLEARALLVSGDSAAAESTLRAVAAGLPASSRRGDAWAMIGDLAMARGDRPVAAEAYRSALTSGAAAAPAGRAARNLLEIGDLNAAEALQVARALERVGDSQRALRGYDLHVSLAASGATPAVRLARAQLMAQQPARHDEAASELNALSTDATLGPAALNQWIALRDRQGRSGDALTLRNRLMERFPASPEAANVLFLRGDAAHDQGNVEAALRDYRRLVEVAPAEDRAGLARMRWGQLHLLRGETREAAEVFEGYLGAYPTGRRWEEATYWAARARLDLGERERARQHIDQLRTREPFGYYAVLAGELIGEPFRLQVPAGEEPPFPEWTRDGLRTLDLLAAAGLREGATWMVAQLRARAREAPAPEGLRLSLELTRRGYSLDGINLASELRARGEPWTRRLLEAVYPFPNAERVQREAREIGADPLLVAALIRQESAWEEAIRSPVGATGLMQIMPETGRQLFQQHQLGEYAPEMLEVGDLNLHLGVSYLVELLERYGGDLPLALSGYNAGPHRADRWKDFPEAGDPLRFTERIPFAETRDYVKRIHRNRAIYGALYGPPSTQQ